jgi:hypothetical protein
MVDYSLSDSVLTAFVITKDRVVYSRQPVDSVFFRQIRQFPASIARMHSKEYITLAHDLYKKLIRPLEPAIRERKRLILIPASCLLEFPFEALLTVPSRQLTTIPDFTRLT